jgi:hypothetical protein
VNETIVVAMITGGLGAVGGVGIWTFLTKWLELGAKRDSEEIARLRVDIGEANRRHSECESRVAELDRRLEAVEHHHSSYMPRWIKNAGKRLVWVNSPAMLSIFAPLGYSRSDVVGRTFSELLDIDAAEEVDRMDRAALALPGKAVSTILQLHVSLPAMVVVKVAGAGRDGEVIYEGYAYCPNDPERERDRGERRQREQIGASALKLAGPAPEDGPRLAA